MSGAEAIIIPIITATLPTILLIASEALGLRASGTTGACASLTQLLVASVQRLLQPGVVAASPGTPTTTEIPLTPVTTPVTTPKPRPAWQNV